MKPDSLAVLNIAWPEGALPVSVVITLIVVIGALVGYALVKVSVIGAAKFFKEYSQDFPSQKATVVVCLGALVFWVLLAGLRMALGMTYPEGYGDIALLIAGGLGFGAAAGVGKHAFSAERATAQGDAAAKIAAATPAQPAQVLAAKGSSVSVSTEAEPATTAKPALPAGGVKPKDPAVVAGVEAIAAAQRVTFGGSSQ